jgi:ubiquinone/menaquinone biosynthesis C-methylase UbiE
MPNNKILEHWDRENTESMYDKYLLAAEIELIKQHLMPNTKILDSGCGEGEGTYVYSFTPGVIIHAADFSETRLKKASERLKGKDNVILKQVDFLAQYALDKDYDTIISQRFLINLMEWELQKKALLDFIGMLKSGGTIVMIEGSRQGVDMLNKFRSAFGMNPIPVQWYNLFLDDNALVDFMHQNACKLVSHDGLSVYFLLTRGIRPFFDSTLNWDSDFNRIASSVRVRDILSINNTRFSRLKLWVFQK